MALNNHQARLREYLLGKLGEAEQEKIEERLMVEDGLFDEFEASKDDLVEEYCADELDTTERQFFEEHFLRSVEGQQRYKFVQAMSCLQQLQPAPIGAAPPAPGLPVKNPGPSLFQGLKDLFANQRWAVATATSLVLLVVVAIIYKQISPRPAGQTFAFANILKSYSQNRGTEDAGPTRIKLPPNIAFLKLRLQLPKSATSGARYTALLDDQVNTKPVKVVETDSQSATVIIPADLVPNHLYAVKLAIVNPDGSEQEPSYRFMVE